MAYKKHKSTLNNLDKTILQMEDVQNKIRSNRDKKGKPPQFFKLNVDAARAFDSILRHKVINILKEKGVNNQLVNAIGNTLR